MDAQLAAARIREALDKHDDRTVLCDRPTLRALLAERDELAKDAGRWRTMLERVVECDWAYMGRDADTGNPDSLYSRVRAGRAALTNKDTK